LTRGENNCLVGEVTTKYLLKAEFLSSARRSVFERVISKELKKGGSYAHFDRGQTSGLPINFAAPWSRTDFGTMRRISGYQADIDHGREQNITARNYEEERP